MRGGVPLGSLCWLGCLAICGPAPAQEGPASILARMNRVYADARSYQDEGTVTMTIVKGDERQVVTRRFSTAFVRPGRLLFEFRDGEDTTAAIRQRYVVWTLEGPDRARRWWTLNPEVQEDTLGAFLAGANTLSGGASVLVPRLLLPAVLKGPAATAPREPKFIGEETLDGVECQVVQGLGAAPNETLTLWVGKSDSLLLKVSKASRIGDFATEETCRYRARTNVALPDSAFTFTPPVKP